MGTPVLHWVAHADPVKHWGAWATAQALRASASKSTWGRAGTPQVGLYHAQGDGVGTRSPTWTTPINGHGQQFDDFSSYNQVLTDATAGWAVSLVNTRSQLGRLEQCEWSFLLKETTSGHTKKWTHNLSIRRLMPWPFGYVASHTLL